MLERTSVKQMSKLPVQENGGLRALNTAILMSVGFYAPSAVCRAT
jgi:hypothetical protein